MHARSSLKSWWRLRFSLTFDMTLRISWTALLDIAMSESYLDLEMSGRGHGVVSSRCGCLLLFVLSFVLVPGRLDGLVGLVGAVVSVGRILDLFLVTIFRRRRSWR